MSFNFTPVSVPTVLTDEEATPVIGFVQTLHGFTRDDPQSRQQVVVPVVLSDLGKPLDESWCEQARQREVRIAHSW